MQKNLVERSSTIDAIWFKKEAHHHYTVISGHPIRNGSGNLVAEMQRSIAIRKNGLLYNAAGERLN